MKIISPKVIDKSVFEVKFRTHKIYAKSKLKIGSKFKT